MFLFVDSEYVIYVQVVQSLSLIAMYIKNYKFEFEFLLKFNLEFKLMELAPISFHLDDGLYVYKPSYINIQL